MKRSNNNQVQKLIEDIQMVDHAKFETLIKLRDVVFSINPKIQERVMYGGIMFSLVSDWGGIFVRKNHISFEFVLGVQLKDSYRILEGKGKLRRHLKLRSSKDIENKRVAYFVKQSLNSM